jgi:predicted acyltransferase
MTYARRFVMLIVIGVILDSLWALGELKFQWGVLQTLGLAGMVSILLLQFTNRKKIIIAISVLVVYGLLLLQNQIFYEYINSTRHGGPLGALSYSVIMIFGFVSSSMLILEQKPYREMIVIGIAIILLSLLCSLVIPYNKLLVTPSYALITAGAGIVLLVALRYFCEKYNITSGPLLLFGRNSLLAWVLQYPLVYYPLMLFEVWTPFGFFEGIMLAFWFVFITYFLVKLAEGHNISLRM